MEASWKVAAVAGVFGPRIARDATYNGLVNDQGCKNTNKPGDLKVTFRSRKNFGKHFKADTTLHLNRTHKICGI